MRKLKMREKRWGHYYQTTPLQKKVILVVPP